MPRVKRGTTKNKKRKNILAKTKGFRHGRKSKIGFAKEAISHAGEHSLRDRRKKKSIFRALWQTKINAAVKKHDLSYSKFISLYKASGIGLDKKILAEIAVKNPKIFTEIVNQVKK